MASTPSGYDDRDVTDVLAEFATEIACPNCGDHALEFVRQVAPEGEANENVETFTGGLGGAFAGGLDGAVFGPAGVIAAMTARVLLGGHTAGIRPRNKN